MRILANTAALLTLLALVTAGCGPGGPDIAGVKGKVTMDGEPLADASVIFVPVAGGRPAAARTDAEGNYELNFSGGRKGTIPGMNKVQITTELGTYEGDDGKMIPARPETVPMEYNTQSTLEVNVVDGQMNEANFDLKSGGKIAPSANDGY